LYGSPVSAFQRPPVRGSACSCAHAAEYAVLGALLLRAFRARFPALLLGVAYAASDELHQHFVRGRHASPVDVAIDTIGLAAGIVFVAHRTSSWAR